MEIISNLLEKAVSGTVPLIVLLGLLIFVHELGHFLVARYYKVKVEVFSLGFGPKLFKMVRGDTTYAISAIPLGGYVKMYGDDPTMDIPEEEKKNSFLHKPVGQRIAVVLAGPLMNLFFAMILFACIGMIGDQTIRSQVGDVVTSSKAFQAGFRSGDLILSFINEPVQRWEEFKDRLESFEGKPVELKLRRELTGEEVTLNFTPESLKNTNILSLEKTVGGIDGLGFASESPVLGISNPESFAAKAGFKTGDIVKSINGKDIKTWREFSKALLTHNTSDPLAFKISRADNLDSEKAKESLIDLNFAPPAIDSKNIHEVISGDLGLENGFGQQGKSSVELLSEMGFDQPDTFVLSVGSETPAKKAGLLQGDKIVAINSEKITSFEDIVKVVSAYKKDNPPLKVSVSRAGVMKDFEVVPVEATPDKHVGSFEPRYVIGVTPMRYSPHVETFIWKTDGLLAAVHLGVVQSLEWSKNILVSFWKLIKAEVSPKNIGSFLSIGQMASKSWEVGVAAFLRVMAIISINLFVLNLLPIPILDGGHLVFFGIEALKGSPVSLKKMEAAQKVGMLALLCLMVFALFNDFSRFFGF